MPSRASCALDGLARRRQRSSARAPLSRADAPIGARSSGLPMRGTQVPRLSDRRRQPCGRTGAADRRDRRRRCRAFGAGNSGVVPDPIWMQAFQSGVGDVQEADEVVALPAAGRRVADPQSDLVCVRLAVLAVAEGFIAYSFSLASRDLSSIEVRPFLGVNARRCRGTFRTDGSDWLFTPTPRRTATGRPAMKAARQMEDRS